MAELRDARREAFCQGLARGLKKTVAYRQAGYSGDRGNASRAAATAEVLQRVEEIRASMPVVQEPEVMPPEVEAVKGEKVTRDSMTADIDLRIAKAEAAGEWPTVAALTATRAKLHGLLLQEQAVATDKNISLLALAQAVIPRLRWALKTGGTAEEIAVRMLGIVSVDDLAALGLRPKPNGHTRPA
jgi:hypothetical protein